MRRLTVLGQEQLQDLFAQMSEGFALHEILLDARGVPTDYRFLAVNPAFEALTGLRASEVVGRTARDAIPDLDPDLVARYGHVALTGEPDQIESVASLGRTFSVRAYRPASMRFACIFSDVTERRRAERERAELLEASRAVLRGGDFAEIARVIFAAAKRLTGASAGYVALLSPSGEENEVLFLDAGEEPCSVDPSLPMPIRGLRAEAYRSGAPAFENDFATSTWRRFLPEGHAPLRNVLFAPLLVEGRPVGLIGLANKPGDFCAADAAAAGALADLAAIALGNSRTHERLVARERELSAALAEVERREEERRALHAILLEAHTMETIGSLAAGIAHDFNNLFGAILGGLSLLELEHGDRPGMRDDLDELKAHVERGTGLVRQLLGYARRGKYNPRPVSIDAVLPGLLAALRRSHAELALVVEANAEGVTVLADRTQLELAVMNLLLNGASATPAGAALRVRTESITLERAESSPHGVPPGRYLRISVTDAGPGLDAAARARAFEPVFDARAATSGLRLASVQGIARNHGGFASVESEPGRGSTFSLYWPVQRTLDRERAVRPEERDGS